MSKMDAEKVVIELKGKMVVLILQPFDGDIDTESLLKIDYSNILGEILTFPVVFNKIANIRAEVANALAEGKLDFEIFEAQLYEEHQTKLAATITGARGPSIKDVEASVLRDPKLLVKKKIYFRKQRDFDYIDSLYWSAKSKDGKLDRLSEKLRPEEFNDLMEGTINGVMIKMTKKSIQ